MQLASAGFFYSGRSGGEEQDRVTCFRCKKSFYKWEKHDNPLRDHIKGGPTCEFASAMLNRESEKSELLERVLDKSIMEEEKERTLEKLRRQKDEATSILLASLEDY